MLRLLLERGASVEAQDKRERRAMHWAAYMGHVEAVNLLISFRADINCRDKQVCRHQHLFLAAWGSSRVVILFVSCDC